MHTIIYDDGVKSAADRPALSSTGASSVELFGRIAPLLPASRSTSLAYDTGTGNRGHDPRACFTRTTIISDRSIGIVEPAGGRTTTVSAGPGLGLRSLISVQASTAGCEQPRAVIDAILLDSELTCRLECAAKKASPSASHPVPREDVAQEAILLLLERMASGPFSYQDQGESQFRGRIGTVVDRTAIKARDAQVPSATEVLVEDMSQFPARASDAELAELIDDVRAAVRKIPKAAVRHAIEDFLHDLTLGQSAELRGCSDSHICDLLKEGKDWLRHYLYGG